MNQFQDIFKHKKSVYRFLFIVLFFVIALGSTIYYISYNLVLNESESRLRDALLEVRALHRYIQNNMHPSYYRLMDEGRLPQGFYAPELLSSSYMVRNFQQYHREERIKFDLPLISYKMAAIDPRNIVNKANKEEEELIKRFNEDDTLDQIGYTTKENDVKLLVVAIPFLRNNQHCLVCHGRQEDAPQQLQELYNWTSGFNRKIGDISAIEIMKTPIKAAIDISLLSTFSAILIILTLSTSFFLNVVYKRIIRQKIDDLMVKQGQLIEERNKSESASKAKSVFLANMSHEIRTPLNGVLGMLDLIKFTKIDKEQSEYLSAASKSAKRLTQLLSDILDISRIEADKMDLVREPFSLVTVKSSLMDLFIPTATEKGLAFQFTIDDDTPDPIVGDISRLQQILFNLAGNAIKFTENGHVGVHIFPLPSEDVSQARILFTVEDTGIGISDEQLEHILNPFEQVENTYARRFQGAGLGLSIVTKVLSLMGGSMAIDSTPEKGTTVYVSIPFHAADKGLNSDQDNGRDQHALPIRCRVLVVEDDSTNLAVCKRLLEKSGCDVAVASNGKEALDAIAVLELDLVLMDIQMPVMGGLEATRRIRESAELGKKSKIPIIAVTSYAMVGDRERFLEAGMDGYVAKPFDIDELRSAITKVMSCSFQSDEGLS